MTGTEHEPGAKTFTLELTKDELTILKYMFNEACNGWGEPLKNSYELGADEPEDPYYVLGVVHDKILKLKF